MWMRPISCALLLAGCGHTLPAAESSGAVPLTVLGPGDVFEVAVYGEKDLSAPYRVSAEGDINFPLIGKVVCDGRTASQVSDEISARLRDFIKQPSVSVFVKEYVSKKIYVFGEVQRPGTFPFELGMNIIQAITLAGGFGKLADKDGTFVTRKVEGAEQRLRVEVKAIGEGKTPNFELKPGDIVYVPESLF